METQGIHCGHCMNGVPCEMHDENDTDNVLYDLEVRDNKGRLIATILFMEDDTVEVEVDDYRVLKHPLLKRMLREEGVSEYTCRITSDY